MKSSTIITLSRLVFITHSITSLVSGCTVDTCIPEGFDVPCSSGESPYLYDNLTGVLIAKVLMYVLLLVNTGAVPTTVNVVPTPILSLQITFVVKWLVMYQALKKQIQ